jgi:vancomycin aglycone glucosyltransferase
MRRSPPRRDVSRTAGRTTADHLSDPAIEPRANRRRREAAGRTDRKPAPGVALDLSPVDDKDDCFAVGEVNHQALFGRVAAVVHHGGAGTTTAAARAGAPQVVVPQMVDQPYWAGRVAALGIGAAHDGPAPTVESLSAALRTGLAPGIRERATTVAGTIRTDGVEAAARLLLEAAGRVGASAHG